MWIRAKNYLKSQRGINTVEVVIILAIVVGLALIFKSEITTFVEKLLERSLDVDKI